VNGPRLFRRLRSGASLAVVAIALSACAIGRVDPHPRVALDTTMGRIVVELDGERAPVTTANFLRYTREGHYDGTIFHRVVETFVVQGGGHLPSMAEKPTGAPIVNEARAVDKGGLSNVTGTIAMARETAIDSATSQFFINVVDNLRLDHVDVPPEGATVMGRTGPRFVTKADENSVFGYAVFGRVVEGMDVVERMRHVAVRTVGEYENVPVTPVVLTKAALLPK
jgi:cyclophilin family peptidyl-prolyl cis-trans isomerase